MTRFSCGKRDSKDEWFLPQSRVYELRQRERDQRELQVPFSPVLVMWLFFFKKWKKTAQKEGNKTSSDDFIHRSGSSRL